MKKKNKRYLGEEITEICENIKAIVKEYLRLGITDFVLNWINDINKWAEKNSDEKLFKLIDNFVLWEDKEALKELISEIEQREQDYLRGNEIRINIFIAHTDGDPFVEKLITLLTELGLNPIIMQRIPSQGDTIFHKFKNIQFGTAIIVLTKDYRLNEKSKVIQCKGNVLIETGYCYGHLEDPSSVVILHDEKVEIPSNIGSVEYIKTDEDWKYNLTKSLKIRGLILS